MMRELGWIVSFILMVVILLMRECAPAPTPITNTHTINRIIPGDSVPYPVPHKVPYPVTEVRTDTHWKYHPVDTQAILADYFITRFYSDTITGHDIKVILHDSINRNRLTARRAEVQNLRPLAIHTEVNAPPGKPLARLLLGANITGDASGVTGLYPSVILALPKGTALHAGTSLFAPQPNLQVGFYLKPNIKRK